MVSSAFTEASSKSALIKPGEDAPAGWPVDALNLFTSRMQAEDPAFPCIFGVDATRRGTLRITFVDKGPDRLPQLAAALREFVDRAELLGRRTSLVAIFEPDGGPQTLDDYRAAFWSLLQGLREQDVRPWPDGISQDTEDSEWEFSFHGQPMFVVVNTPVHKRRRSRYFEYFAITFQPRFVFEGLGDTPQGRSAKSIIRERLNKYDDLPPAPVLGSFGVPGNREWAQYFLDDENDPFDEGARCPLRS